MPFLLQGISQPRGLTCISCSGRYYNVINKMLVSPTLKINRLKLTLLCGRLGHESSVLKDRPCALPQRPQKDPRPFQYGRGPSPDSRKQAPARHQVSQGLDHDVPASRTVKAKAYLSQATMVFCYSSQNRLEHIPIHVPPKAAGFYSVGMNLLFVPAC